MRVAVNIAVLLTLTMDASAQRSGGVIGHPAGVNHVPRRGAAGPDRSVSQPFRPIGVMAGKGSRVLGNVSSYFVPYPVYDAGGSYSDTMDAEPEAGADATSDAGITGRYVDTRGPYVDSRGPYVDPTDAYLSELTSRADVPQAPVPIPAEEASLPPTSIHSMEAGAEPGLQIDNDDALPRFWIALKNHWVYTATAYWVEGGTLHYITAQGTHNQVPLRLVDWQTFARLNGATLQTGDDR